jgi:Domain of unknown function (DUF1929)/Fibronectin type III domain
MSGIPISRRDFLLLLGYGLVTLALGSFMRLDYLGVLKKLSSPPLASAQSSGSWSLGQKNTTIVAIHAALLPSGKIFYLAGSGFHGGRKYGPFEARILDLNTGSEQNLQQSEDLFCAGQCNLPNGNVLLVGGTLLYDTDINNCNGFWHGLKSAYEAGESPASVVKVSSMAHGRWYPTCVTLSDGKVFTVNGFDEYGIHNRLVEVYDPSTKSWTKSFDPSTSNTYCVGGQETACPGAGSPCYGSPNNGVATNTGIYPRAHLMPSGLVVTCSSSHNNGVRTWDPSTGQWKFIGSTLTKRDYGTTFLLPLNNNVSERGKILLVGGSPSNSTTDPAITTVEIIDFNAGSSTSPVIRTVASISKRRKYLNPVILPNGKCVIFSGSEVGTSQYVNFPEMFDPVTETWTNLPAATVPRSYHGVALLLPDGRVWTAGSTPSKGVWELRTELFSPGYYFEARPTISGIPTVGNYGGTIVIPTSDAPNINSVSLLRLGSQTHHYDPDSRLIWLQIVSSNSSSVTVSAPVNARLAPPGYYMIHVLNSSGVPSVAQIIKIPGLSTGDTTPPSQVTGLTVTPVSSTQLNLAWTANTETDFDHYNVYRGTTAGFAVNTATATPVGQPTTNSFSNTGLAASTTYYYKVAAVDRSGNIGALSTEASGTTNTTTTTIFYNVAIPGNSSVELRSGANVRGGEEAATASSLLIGKSLKSWKVRLRRRSNPSGNITAKVRRTSDDAVVATFSQTIDSRTLSTSFAEYTFTLTTPYIIASGDRILIEYSGRQAVQIEIWAEDKFDSTNTRSVEFTTSYLGINSSDITGTMQST